MASKQKNLVLNIKRIKDNIKKRYKTFKDRLIPSERENAIKFKPLIEPIKQLTDKFVKQELTIKQEDLVNQEVPSDTESIEFNYEGNNSLDYAEPKPERRWMERIRQRKP